MRPVWPVWAVHVHTLAGAAGVARAAGAWFIRTPDEHVFPCTSLGTGTFRAQDLSFPKTNSPYGELSFPRLFVPGNFRSRGTGNFRSLDLSFRGTFVPRTFRSQELSFLRLFYKALVMNLKHFVRRLAVTQL